VHITDSAHQIAHFSKTGDFKTGRNGHSGFEIGEVVHMPPSFKMSHIVQVFSRVPKYFECSGC
jgi:hypothetical protein